MRERAAATKVRVTFEIIRCYGLLTILTIVTMDILGMSC